jgi:hypothetical protein
VSKIFGGSKSKSKQQSQSHSTSGNRAFEPISQAFLPQASSAYAGATSQLGEELSGGWEGYKQKRDFDFMRALGLDRTAGSFSGRGIFNSGATLKRLSEFDNSIHNQYYQDYLNNLFRQAQTGAQGAGLVAGTGGFSESRSSASGSSSGKSSPGIGGFLGGLVSGIAG